MSNTEAKFLLNAYRPSGADASDPSFAGSLEQARQDPALAEWFAREQSHARAVSAKLREIAPPATLRDAILAGARASQPKPRRAGWRPLYYWSALAACVTVLAGGILFRAVRAAASAEALTTFALADARDESKHDGHGDANRALQAKLGATTSHLANGVAVDLAALAGTGCRTLRVAGYDVVEVCFVRNGVVFHCYIARMGGLGGSGPRLVQQEGLVAATWRHQGYRYVVVTNAGEDAVKALL